MAIELATPEVVIPAVVRSFVQRAEEVRISCNHGRPLTVTFAEYQLPKNDGVLDANSKAFLRDLTIDIDTTEKLTEVVTYTSPLDQSTKSITVADIAEAITQYYVNKTEVVV